MNRKWSVLYRTWAYISVIWRTLIRPIQTQLPSKTTPTTHQVPMSNWSISKSIEKNSKSWQKSNFFNPLPRLTPVFNQYPDSNFGSIVFERIPTLKGLFGEASCFLLLHPILLRSWDLSYDIEPKESADLDQTSRNAANQPLKPYVRTNIDRSNQNRFFSDSYADFHQKCHSILSQPRITRRAVAQQ